MAIRVDNTGSLNVTGGTAILGGTSGSLLFVDSSGNLGQDNTNIFYDDTNNFFGLGINSSLLARAHIKGSGATSTTRSFYVSNSTPTELFEIRNDGYVYGGRTMEVSDNNLYKDANVLFTGESASRVWLFNFYDTGIHRMSLSRAGLFRVSPDIDDPTSTAMGTFVANTSTTPVLRVCGATSQTANLLESMNSSSFLGAGINAYMEFFHNGYINVTGTENSVFGQEAGRAFTSANSNALFGYQAGKAITSGDQNVAIGTALNGLLTGSRNMAVGVGALGVGTAMSFNTAVGFSALQNTTGAENVGIGDSAGQSNTTGLYNVFIGSASGGVAVSTSRAIAIGRNAQTATEHFVAGSDSAPIIDVYFSEGITNATPVAWTLHGTGGLGTDIVGADIIIAAGKATGAGVGGNILWQTSDVAGSSATLQTLTTKMTLNSLGRVGIGGVPSTVASQKLLVHGALAFGDGTNKLGRTTYTSVGGDPAFAAETGKGWTWYTDDANVTAFTLSSAGLATFLAGAVFNENGSDFDFRIEGDTNANLFLADASQDKLFLGDTEIALDGTPNTDHTSNGKTVSTFNAGATITVMDLVYMGSSSKWLLTDADAAATAIGMLAISLESKTDTQAMKVALPGGFVRDDTWNWTPGAILYVDTATPGALTATAPSGTDDIVRVVGHAVTADVIFFNPSGEYTAIV